MANVQSILTMTISAPKAPGRRVSWRKLQVYLIDTFSLSLSLSLSYPFIFVSRGLLQNHLISLIGRNMEITAHFIYFFAII